MFYVESLTDETGSTTHVGYCAQHNVTVLHRDIGQPTERYELRRDESEISGLITELGDPYFIDDEAKAIENIGFANVLGLAGYVYGDTTS